MTIGALEGTATKDTDYTATSLASITIPANAGNANETLTITPTDDDVVEGDETIIIPGTTTTEVGLTVTSATVTLTDHSSSLQRDTAKLSISGPASNVSEGSDATFTVTLSKAVAKEVRVAWSTPLSTDTTKAADLGTTTSGTVTFAANSAAGATQTITVAVKDDSLSETSESFTVTLGTVGGDLLSQVSVDSSAGSAAATIDESDPITVDISGPTGVGEGDETSDYTVSLSPSGVTPTADLTVSYATSDDSTTAGSDYTAKSGTLTFTEAAPGAQTFTVQTTEDTLDESDETFIVTISSLSGGGGPTPSLGTSSVTTTITDDDDTPSDIALSVSPSTLGEDDSATSVTVTATLQGDSTRTSDTVVTIEALSGTATKDTDYTATSLASVTIDAGDASGTATITITPTDDSVVEGDETITISGTTTVDLDVSPAEITLTDDDKSTTAPGDKDAATVSIAGPVPSVSEGGEAVFTVTLSHQVDAEVIVAWSAPLAADVAKGIDLGSSSGTVTFPANSAAGAAQTITIATVDDALSEPAESFTVTLGSITSNLSSQVSIDTSAGSAEATIAESDPITVNISGPSSVGEGEAATYTVSLSPDGVTPTEDLTVDYATSDNTAEAGSDYTAASGTLTFSEAAARPQTFTVETTEDSIDEGAGETFTVTVSNLAGGGAARRPASASASVTSTITDDDGSTPAPTPPSPPPPPPPPPPPTTPTSIDLAVSPDRIVRGCRSHVRHGDGDAGERSYPQCGHRRNPDAVGNGR